METIIMTEAATWTGRQENQLIKMIKQKVRIKNIVLILGFTEKQIYYKLYSIERRTELPPQKRMLRMCLGCHNNFMSNGPGNRRCPKCKHHVNNSGVRPQSISALG